jgi:hypothetical protein
MSNTFPQGLICIFLGTLGLAFAQWLVQAQIDYDRRIRKLIRILPAPMSERWHFVLHNVMCSVVIAIGILAVFGVIQNP